MVEIARQVTRLARRIGRQRSHNSTIDQVTCYCVRGLRFNSALAFRDIPGFLQTNTKKLAQQATDNESKHNPKTSHIPNTQCPIHSQTEELCHPTVIRMVWYSQPIIVKQPLRTLGVNTCSLEGIVSNHYPHPCTEGKTR